VIVDTHCHLLPGVDDGPRNIARSLELARELRDCGVGAVVCTPHYSRQFPVTREAAQAAARSLRSALAAESIPLTLGVAAEVSPTLAVSASLDELEQRSISGYVVVEVLADTPVPFLATVTERLAERALRPVVAHPELARSVERHPEALDDVRAAGGLVQVLAAGVVGYWGERVASFAWELIESGRADLLGSDAHGRRRPAAYFARARKTVGERLGAGVAHNLTEKAPAQLLVGVGADSWA